jgi:fumarylacetoacetase
MATASWVPVPEGSGYGLGHLPYGAFRRDGESARIGVRVGDHVLDLAAVAAEGLLDEALDGAETVFAAPRLNPLLERGAGAWRAVRARLGTLLDGADRSIRSRSGLAERALVSVAEVRLELPFEVGDYVDFYSSLEHATNLGRLFRPDAEPLLPNWRHLPVCYHGRAGTVVVSGTDIVRPRGQRKPPSAPAPVFGPSARLDIELEVGFVTGRANRLGEPVPVPRAEEHIFGLVLVNDWSARDIQAWEYQPLGPFLGKSFATSISPWVVPLEALAPFRVPGPDQDPPVLDYLRRAGAANIDLELRVRLNGGEIAATNFRHMYWSMAQQLAHATANGATARAGDLFASGTVSGPGRRERGSLIELSWNGAEPIELADGSTRTFLEDGDEVTISGWCGGDGRPRIDFGEVSGRIVGSA